jgi:type IX secretion system PorP/SprF family membrane protein
LKNIVDAGDPLYLSNQSIWTPKFDFGVYYYGDRYYLGLSVPNVLAIDSRTVDNKEAGLKRHFFFNGGYVWDLGKNGNVKFKPSFLVKFEPAAPITFDINAHFLFFDRLWAGASYRYNNAIVGMLQFQITSKLRLGYAYDYTTTAIRSYQGGSHEIMIGYDFAKTQVKIVHPRYF